MGRIVRDHHDAKFAAHAGVKKTQQWIRKRYYWPNLHRDVEDYVLSCDQCACLKAGRVTTAPMGSLPEAREPGEVASIDITGPYATSKRGNRYLLTYLDHFTKWAEAVPLPDQEATTVANALVMHIFTRHGVCDKLQKRSRAELHIRINPRDMSTPRSGQNIHQSVPTPKQRPGGKVSPHLTCGPGYVCGPQWDELGRPSQFSSMGIPITATR